MNIQTLEIDSIDHRYEQHRLKDKKREGAILLSVEENGIRDPLLGVMKDKKFILLDGFKRWRCARKLKINVLPYQEFDGDESCGIIKLLQISNNRSLHILEQAALVDELKETHGLKVNDIARAIDRSPAWVSIRLGILSEFSAFVKEQVFLGNFPTQNLLYTLRPFRRLNKIPKSEIDDFVKAVQGNGISTRDIHLLGNEYFKGGQETKEQINQGKISWYLQYIKDRKNEKEKNNFPGEEERILRDMEIVQKHVVLLLAKLPTIYSSSSAFKATASIVVDSLIEKMPVFVEKIGQLQEQIKNDR